METLFNVVPQEWLWATAAIFGALWGSFANVVICRWPRGMSVVRPASHCFSCGQPIQFYDNIPILSYLILRGRCRHCGARFSPRHAIVELCLALLSVAVLKVTLLADPPSLLFGLVEYGIGFAFVLALVTAAMIDLETYLLPDAITLPGIAVGLLANAFVLKTGWKDPLLAAAGSYAVLMGLFVYGYRRLMGHPGMGEGDPKLVAMIGAFLGVKGALFSLFLGAFQGLAIGFFLILYRRRTGKEPALPIADEALDEQGNEIAPDPRFRKAKVPFGPFLALGAIEYFFFGEKFLTFYFGAIGRLLGLE